MIAIRSRRSRCFTPSNLTSGRAVYAWRKPMALGLLLCQLLIPATSISADTPKTLNLGNTGEPQTLDPHRYNLRLEETLLNDLFLGLTTFNAKGEIVPGAAESWTQSADGLIWTFNLREDLRWSDGTPLTAEDFVYSFRRLLNPKTAASLAYFLYMIENAAQVNQGAMPYFLERLLYPVAFPVPKHVIEREGDSWIKPEHWVSNGAYALKTWQPQAYVEMTANPHFFTNVAIKTVRYHPLASEQSGYNRYRSGELDAIPSVPTSELQTLKTASNETANTALRLSPLLSSMYLVFNVQEPPFADLRVRKALSMAVDQNILTTKVMRSGDRPSYTFAPSLISNYQPATLDHKGIALSERQAMAKQLLAQAGFTKTNPLTITLRHVSGIEGKKINLAIAGMWRSIGVKTTLHQAELKAHFTDLRQGKFSVAWAGWIGENNAEHYLSLLQSDIGSVNYGRYQSNEFDALMRSAQEQADLSKRNDLLSAAANVAVKDYPVVPLYNLSVRRLVSPQLNGWEDNLRDMHQVRYLSWEEAR
jgi:oligopeptide transport system substrate-binding protein